MVRSESADEEFMLSSGKASANEEDDEYVQWTHSSRRASSSCRGLGEDDTPPNGVACSMAGVDELSDRRIRRQIANCNERRRMQSINAGFQSLRSLLPKRDGEKMSKAAILQHTAELIQSLKAEKMRLLEEKEAAIQAKKRRIEDEDLHDRGIVDELTVALEQERRLRQLYEEQLREKQLPHVPSLLSPISTPATQQPSSIPSPVLLDSRRMRPPPHDINGLYAHTMTFEELVTGSGGGGGATSPFMQFEPQASLHHAAVAHNTHHHRVSTSTTSFTCGGTAQAVVGNGVVAMDCGGGATPATATNVANVANVCVAAPQTSTTNTTAAMVDGMHQQTPLLMNSMENHSTANLSHRNLNAILEAIRHLEGGAAPVMVAQSPPLTPTPRPPTQHSNVLVR